MAAWSRRLRTDFGSWNDLLYEVVSGWWGAELPHRML